MEISFVRVVYCVSTTNARDSEQRREFVYYSAAVSCAIGVRECSTSESTSLCLDDELLVCRDDLSSYRWTVAELSHHWSFDAAESLYIRSLIISDVIQTRRLCSILKSFLVVSHDD